MIARLLGVGGIVIYPFVLFAEQRPSEQLFNHEMIHVEQIRKIGILLFYFYYLKEYATNRIKGLSHYEAYMAISYEKEAYQNENKKT